MSETVLMRGKIKAVEIGEDSLEDYCRKLANSKGITEIHSYNHSWMEEVQYELPNYMVLNGKLYEVLESEDLDAEDLRILNKHEDGIIDYAVSFYTGGTCLSEVLEDGLRDMEEQ